MEEEEGLEGTLLPWQGSGFFLAPCLAWGDAPGGESWEERSTHGSGSCSPSQHPPRHCGNSGKMWASGADIWHKRGLFLWELMWK